MPNTWKLAKASKKKNVKARPSHIRNSHHKRYKPISKTTDEHRHHKKKNHNDAMASNNHIIGMSIHATST